MHENRTTNGGADPEDWKECGAWSKGDHDETDTRKHQRDAIFRRWASEMKEAWAKGALVLIAVATISLGVSACQSGSQNVRDGSATDAKGKVESAVGDVTGNDSLKTVGQVDQAKGEAQKDMGKAQQKVDKVANP
jgi:uncharacterized protein YjbJ (UPF0337 family)